MGPVWSLSRHPWCRPRPPSLDAGLAGKPADALLVTAADKTQNGLCIAADVRRYGAEFWETFNARADELAWYYTSVRDLVATRHAAGPGRLRPAWPAAAAAPRHSLTGRAPRRVAPRAGLPRDDSDQLGLSDFDSLTRSSSMPDHSCGCARQEIALPALRQTCELPVPRHAGGLFLVVAPTQGLSVLDGGHPTPAMRVDVVCLQPLSFAAAPEQP